MNPTSPSTPSHYSISYYIAALWKGRHIALPVVVVTTIALAYLLVYQRAYVTIIDFKVNNVPENAEVFTDFVYEAFEDPENAALVGTLEQVQQKLDVLSFRSDNIGSPDVQQIRRFLEVKLVPSIYRSIKRSESLRAKRIYRRRQVEIEGELNLLHLNQQTYSAKITALKTFLTSGTDNTQGIQPPVTPLMPGKFGFMSDINLVPIKAQLSFFELALEETNSLLENAKQKLVALELLANMEAIPPEMKKHTREAQNEIFFKTFGTPAVSSVMIKPPSPFKLIRNAIFSFVAACLVGAAALVTVNFFKAVKRNYLTMISKPG